MIDSGRCRQDGSNSHACTTGLIDTHHDSTSERLISIWRMATGEDLPPHELDLLKIKKIITEHDFVKNTIDEATIELARLMKFHLVSTKLPSMFDDHSKTLLNIANFLEKSAQLIRRLPPMLQIKILQEIPSEHPLATQPVAIPTQFETLSAKLVYASEGGRVAGPWKEADENIHLLLMKLGRAAREISEKSPRSSLGGRPERNRLTVGFIDGLSLLWAAGTGRERNLSGKRFGFISFALDVCCHPPIELIETEVKGAVRQILTEAKEMDRKNAISTLTNILEREPYNLDPETAQRAARAYPGFQRRRNPKASSSKSEE